MRVLGGMLWYGEKRWSGLDNIMPARSGFRLLLLFFFFRFSSRWGRGRGAENNGAPAQIDLAGVLFVTAWMACGEGFWDQDDGELSCLTTPSKVS
jgi:hypothetical protein